LGHDRIACLSCAEARWQSWAPRRRGHFESAINQRDGCECRSWKIDPAGPGGLEIAREILTCEFRPTAVFAVTDHEAIYVYQAARQLGLRIPQDISVVGFADLDFAESLSPPLTTMRQRPKEIGRQAARLTIDRIDGIVSGSDPATIRVGTDLIVRESTGPASHT
jgi:DNA-binding LacI/PurR family transcriptional regulator